jgi:hypothetical protein
VVQTSPTPADRWRRLQQQFSRDTYGRPQVGLTLPEIPGSSVATVTERPELTTSSMTSAGTRQANGHG